MNKKNFLIAAISAISIVVALCGCADVNSGETLIASDSNSNQTLESYSIGEPSASSIPLVGEMTSDGMNSFPEKCKIYKQTSIKFTEEQLLLLFPETAEKAEDNNGRISYRTATEKGVVDNEGTLLYYTLAGDKFDTICATDYFEDIRNADYEEGELDFATREETLKQVEILTWDLLGLSPNDWYTEKFYAVKKEVFEKYKQAIIEEAASPETKKSEYLTETLNAEVEVLNKITGEDYYFLSIGFKLDEIKTYPGGIFYYAPGNSNAVIGSMCTIVFTENGVEYAYFGNIRDTETAGAEDVDIISPDEAKVLMQKKIDSVIWQGEVEIYYMQLMYLPIPQNNLGEYFTNFETRPYYAFYYKVPEKFEDTIIISNQITYFDAVTGEELGTE